MSDSFIDPKSGFYKGKPYNPKTDYKPYVPHDKEFKPPTYTDPLRGNVREYEGNFEFQRHIPYEHKHVNVEYREYKGPFVDALTGKSRLWGKPPPPVKPTKKGIVREPNKQSRWNTGTKLRTAAKSVSRVIKVSKK